MIEEIVVKNVTVYDNEGINIKDLDKVNFIYGANGSGKTTISRYLNNPQESVFANCSIKWKNDIPLKVYVYNKDFRENNLGKSDIEGIFTLGQATKEQIEEVERKKEELNNVKNQIIEKRKSKNSLNEKMMEEDSSFKEIIWKQIYKKNETQFKGAVGYQTKDKFKNQIISVYQNGVQDVGDRKVLENKAELLLGQPPERITRIDIIGTENVEKIEKSEQWRISIVGRQDINISGLIQKLNNGDWVNQGRKYIADTNICPFCQQNTIDLDFKRQLEDFFDDEYDNAIMQIKLMRDNYIESSGRIIDRIARLVESNNEKLDLKKVENLFADIQRVMQLNCSSMENKIAEPSKKIELKNTDSLIKQINQLIEEANQKIDEHNRIVDNFDVEKRKIIDEVWGLLVEENKAIIDAHINMISGYQKGIRNITALLNDLEKKSREIDAEIKQKNKNITSVQPAVDEINRILKNYGFNSFSIIPSTQKPNFYQIRRENGVSAERTLSEGEETFISFLYFLEWIKGGISEDAVNEERIIVVDDPISSLDSSVLFVVSSLLKDVLRNISGDKGVIRQAIIFTHNVYFHKELSFTGNGNNPQKDTRYWILRKKNGVPKIQYYGIHSPISTSYELLWKELKESDSNSGITIQNIMRRIIENYFKLLGKYSDNSIIDQFPDYESQEICRSLISWVNEGSHGMSDDLYIEWPDTAIEKYKEVFKQIFEKTGQIQHYNMMMGSC